MKKGFLFLSLALVFVGFGLLVNSCNKTKDTQVRLAYSVDSILDNVYVGDTGYTHWPLKVSFLGGNPTETVTITINGLPQRLTVTPNPLTATPTFTQDFVFKGNYAPHGSYPANLVAYSPSTGNKVYAFNLVVVTANCAFGYDGTYSGSNICTTANSGYTCTMSHTSSDSMNVVNFGGLGSNTNTKIILNCGVDSVTIPNQVNGNGDTIKGLGTYTASQFVISYTRRSSGGGFDSCVTTLTKQ